MRSSTLLLSVAFAAASATSSAQPLDTSAPPPSPEPALCSVLGVVSKTRPTGISSPAKELLTQRAIEWAMLSKLKYGGRFNEAMEKASDVLFGISGDQGRRLVNTCNAVDFRKAIKYPPPSNGFPSDPALHAAVCAMATTVVYEAEQGAGNIKSPKEEATWKKIKELPYTVKGFEIRSRGLDGNKIANDGVRFIQERYGTIYPTKKDFEYCLDYYSTIPSAIEPR